MIARHRPRAVLVPAIRRVVAVPEVGGGAIGVGKIAQCQMHLDNPVGDVSNSDPLRLTAAGPIRNLSVDEKEGCRDCSFRYRCTGGCALETFRATGRWDISSPHCQIYTTLYPQAMRLEGLRLLKVHGYLVQ